MQSAQSNYQWTVSNYHRLIEAGILGEDDHVELINGELVQMAPINPPHAAAVDTLARLFFKQAPDDVLVRVQNPITLSQDSEPEPDVALVRTVDHGYKQRHPSAAEIFLVVEIGDSSARADRVNKVPLYARFGVMEVWVIDLAARQVWIYADPENGQYKTVRPCQDGQIIPRGVSAIKIDVSTLL